MDTVPVNTYFRGGPSAGMVRIINDSSTTGLQCTFGNFADRDPGAGIDFEAGSMSCTGLQIQNLMASSTISNVPTYYDFLYPTLWIVFLLTVFVLGMFFTRLFPSIGRVK